MSAAQRPVAEVARWIPWLLAGALAAQVAWRLAERPAATGANDLPPAPSSAALRAASLGEPAALARLGMVWLQAFDSRGDNDIPYQRLDYGRLTDWLRAILELDGGAAVQSGGQ